MMFHSILFELWMDCKFIIIILWSQGERWSSSNNSKRCCRDESGIHRWHRPWTRKREKGIDKAPRYEFPRNPSTYRRAEVCVYHVCDMSFNWCFIVYDVFDMSFIIWTKWQQLCWGRRSTRDEFGIHHSHIPQILPHLVTSLPDEVRNDMENNRIWKERSKTLWCTFPK